MSVRRCIRYGLGIGAVLALAATRARAQGAPPALLDDITDDFEAAAAHWEQGITQLALRLFWLLATIEVVWTGLVIAFKGSGLQEFFAELVRRIIFVGFFLALLTNAHDWSRAIVNSFQRTGEIAVQESLGGATGTDALTPSGSLKPSAVAAVGIRYSRRIAKAAPSILRNAGGALFFGVASLLVLAGFGSIATRQVAILAEMYVVLSAGILVLGFGPCRWTSDYATRYLRYCVSVGVKLLFIQLTVALSLHFLARLTSSTSPISFNRAASVTMSMGVLSALVWSVPNIAVQFLQGVSAFDGREVMVPTELASAAARSVTGGATSTGQAVLAAARLATTQGSAGGGANLTTGAAREGSGQRPLAGSFAARLSSNLQKAATVAAAAPDASSLPSRGRFGTAMAETLNGERGKLSTHAT